MSVRAWRKESLVKHAKTWRRSKRITKRLASKPPKERAKKRDMAMSSESLECTSAFCACVLGTVLHFSLTWDLSSWEHPGHCCKVSDVAYLLQNHVADSV